MSEFTASPGTKDALDRLIQSLRDEPVPDCALAPGDEALCSDFRKVIALLRACGQQAAAGEPGGQPGDPPISTERSAPEAKAGPKVEPPEDEAPTIAASPVNSLLTIRRSVTFKNARAGEAYAETLKLDGARDLVMIDEGGCGLTFDAAGGTMTGVPSGPGDFELKFSGMIDGRPADIIAKLAVIPDPKTLWTSLPSDRSDPYWKPDEDFCLLRGEGLRMIAASKRGRSHAKNGGFREDDFVLATHGPWHIAVVADGAGSARYSRRGSRLAVETVAVELPALLDQHLGDALETLLDQLPERPELEGELRGRLYETLVTAADKAVEALERQATDLGEPPESLATTLILAIARRLAKRWFVAAFAVGDGGAALLDLEAGEVTPLTTPDSGEYAGQTRFLARSEFGSLEEGAKRFRFIMPERFTAIALMTDGITDPKLPTEKALADPEAWSAFWLDDLAKDVDFAAPEDELKAQFSAWLDFWSPGNHDDRTLAVLIPWEMR